MLGIDVSKDTLACTLFDPHTHKALWTKSFPNTSQGIARLLKQTPAESPWALEPTGRYSTAPAKLARKAGRDVRLAQPKAAQRFLQSLQSRAKTDRLDSAGIGLFALSRSLPPYPLKPPVIEELDQLLSARKGLGQAIASLGLQARELPHAAPALQMAIASLKEQQQQLEVQIAALTAQEESLEVARRLQSVPGIGPIVAATVASRLAAHHFVSSDAFVAYCGLDIGVRQSGKRSGNTGLTKQGDGELRRLLYLAAQANLKTLNSPFKHHYQRERDKGLSSTAALCAVARKLARLCWSLHAHNTFYQPERVYQNSSKTIA
jgi:transposase